MKKHCSLLVFVAFCVSVLARNEPTWPFKLADQYMEEFKATVDGLEKLASGYEIEQNAGTSGVFTLDTDEAKATIDPIHYDFIIVGGGTSGSILASRLSEVPEWKILLLEAGDRENAATRVPKNWEILKNTHYNWAFSTTPQNYTCLGAKDHQCVIPSARMLGGSSAFNNMVYTRGNPRDFDVWADLGNLGWCWSDVLPVYKTIEDMELESFDPKYHRHGGLQHLENPQFTNGLAKHVVEAAHESGVRLVDYNGKYQTGVALPQLTTDCGQRFSTAYSYLKRTSKRDNLVVKSLSQVVKLLITPHTKEVQGVQYVHDNHLVTAKAKKEVILAAGAINTPKILILSGIGPESECDKHKIENLVDLKVGRDLKIRPSFIGLDFLYKDQGQAGDEYQKNMEYLKFGRGPLSAPGVEALLFLTTGVTRAFENYPDVELQFVNSLCPKFEELAWMGISSDVYESVWKHCAGKQAVKVVVTLNHPKSTGHLDLKSRNPLDSPIIEPHFFTDDDDTDRQALLAGIEKSLELSHQESFKNLGLALNHQPVHGCEKIEFGSKSYWECALKYLVVPTEDVSGTARMGPKGDGDAVVNNKLKVYGVHNLRVADASVIPVSVSGSLMGTKMVIGEKAAKMIIEEWQKY